MTVDISSLTESYKQISEASRADAMLMGKVGVLIKEIVVQELGYDDFSDFSHAHPLQKNPTQEKLEEFRQRVVKIIKEEIDNFVKDNSDMKSFGDHKDESNLDGVE